MLQCYNYLTGSHLLWELKLGLKIVSHFPPISLLSAYIYKGNGLHSFRIGSCERLSQGLFDNMFKLLYFFICIKLRDIKSAGSTTSSPPAWKRLLRLVSHSTWERLLRLALVSSLATVTTDSLSQAGLTPVEHEQKPMVGRKIYFSLIGSLEKKSVIWGRPAAQQLCRTLNYFTFSSS